MDEPEARHASAIINDPDKGWDDQPEEKRVPENDPTEYLPVMRHHLHETLWALNVALGNAQAMDLAESYRQGLTMPKESPLARQLERSHMVLSQYLGLLDEEDEDGEPVPEDE
jgi:hypothetical protein